jgi:hypothetical protein
MINFKQLVYGKINLQYDRELFINEYDQVIAPRSVKVYISDKVLNITAHNNREWNMVDPDIYSKIETRSAYNHQHITGEYPTWDGISLVYLDCEDVEFRESSKLGSIAVRNYALDNYGEYKFLPEYENLEITKFIKNLPLTDIIGVRCLSLPSNTFGIIHRDNRNSLPKNGTVDNKYKTVQQITNNKIWAEGFIQITINISDGGVPLMFVNTEQMSKNTFTTVEPIYLFNDFVFHGVPLTTGIRRQIRITGRPTPELVKLIEESSIVNIVS